MAFGIRPTGEGNDGGPVAPVEVQRPDAAAHPDDPGAA